MLATFSGAARLSDPVVERAWGWFKWDMCGLAIDSTGSSFHMYVLIGCTGYRDGVRSVCGVHRESREEVARHRGSNGVSIAEPGSSCVQARLRTGTIPPTPCCSEFRRDR